LQAHAKTPVQLAKNLDFVPAGIIGYFQGMAEMDDTAGDR
jgi:hypothetical protein